MNSETSHISLSTSEMMEIHFKQISPTWCHFPSATVQHHEVCKNSISDSQVETLSTLYMPSPDTFSNSDNQSSINTNPSSLKECRERDELYSLYNSHFIVLQDEEKRKEWEKEIKKKGNRIKLR